MGNAEPGETQMYTFTIKNTGTIPIENYRLFFSKVINTFINARLIEVNRTGNVTIFVP